MPKGWTVTGGPQNRRPPTHPAARRAASAVRAPRDASTTASTSSGRRSRSWWSMVAMPSPRSTLRSQSRSRPITTRGSGPGQDRTKPSSSSRPDPLSARSASSITSPPRRPRPAGPAAASASPSPWPTRTSARSERNSGPSPTSKVLQSAHATASPWCCAHDRTTAVFPSPGGAATTVTRVRPIRSTSCGRSISGGALTRGTRAARRSPPPAGGRGRRASGTWR